MAGIRPKSSAAGIGSPHTVVRSAMLLGAPLIAVLCGVIGHQAGGLEAEAAICLVVALWTALWWVFEPVPIAAASLLPLALLPLFGILDAGQVASSYGHKLVLLLLGGFLLSKGMEKSGAHRRIALGMVRVTGRASGRRLIFGFMLATAFLSMWISNTATTLMMLPMALAVLGGEAGGKDSGEEADDHPLTVPLLLGIAFAANVGGMATPIGTPPNVVMIGAYKELGYGEISFAGWMKYGLPITCCMLLIIWLWLTRKLGRGGGSSGEVAIHLPKPGAWRTEEVFTLIVFALTALAWITRAAPFGGWQAWLSLPGANDASVALIAALLMFSLPNGMGKGGRLLDWKSANEIPWGLLVLVGAGLALGAGIKESGLSAVIASGFSGLADLPLPLLLISVALLVTFLTELTSNTATTNVLMPVAGAAAMASQIDPILLMLPAAISASCAFMLPVATLPNAVVFGSGKIPIRTMAREGFVLNLFGALVVTSVCYFLLR